MIVTIIDVLCIALICVLFYKVSKLTETLRVVARMAAGADKEPEPTPDAEKARRAAEAIDKFNDGIANILSYSGGDDK